MDNLEYILKLESEGLLHDVPVSKEFRMLLMKTYNMAAIEDRVFLAYLLYTDFTDKDSSNAVIDTLTVAKLYGAEKQGLQRNFRVLKRIEEFVAQTGIQLIVTEYSRLDGEARTALPLLTRELELLRERDTLETRQEILFISGEKFSGRWRAREQQKRRQRRASVVLDSSRENASVAQYLNATPSNIYSKFAKNINKAKEYVLSNLTGKTRVHQLRILKELEVYFPPAYKQVDNSERLYTLGYSAVYLKKKVREILFDTCWKADLSNAHLVIAARLWGLQDVLALLEREGKIWPYLLRELLLPNSAKKALKTSIYSAVYGMPIAKVKAAVTKRLTKRGQ